MEYRASSDGRARTTAYRFSVADKDDPNLIALKSSIAQHNIGVRKLARKYGQVWQHNEILRVTLMARGGRRDADGNSLHPNADSCLRHKHAYYYDVYVHTDGCSQHNLKREIDMGLTPGELARYDRLKNAVWRLELEGKMRKRNADR